MTHDKASLPPEAKSITSDDIIDTETSAQNDEDSYADPATDIDPRTSNTGMTSVGASDLNADEAQDGGDDAESVPGVRRGG